MSQSAVAGAGAGDLLLLMRHGQHTDGRLTDAALTDTRNVARRLVEWLDGEFRDPHEVVIVATGSPEVMQTAQTVHNECDTALRKLERQRSCKPTSTVNWGGSLADKALAENLKLPHVQDLRVLGAYNPVPSAIKEYRTRLSAAARHGKSFLLVGNDPFVGWLAGGLTGRDTALGRGELLCLRRRPDLRGWRVLWNIAVESPTLADDLREKIKSKMDSAKALGAVVVALLTYLLTRGMTELPSLWTWLAVAALALAAWFYFAALFLYDSLLMPSRFWGNRLRGPEPPEGANCLSSIRRRWGRGPRAVQRPPASTERLLHDAMTHVWIWVFQPATVLVGVGVVLLAVAGATRSPAQPTAPGPAQPTAPSLAQPTAPSLAQPTAPGLLIVLLVTAGLAVFAVLYVLWHRPRLGASD
jgi:hypothetical protein